MGADDVKPTRLEAARREARAFLDRAARRSTGSRSSASPGAPTSRCRRPDDRDLAVEALRSLHTAEGTSLGDAVASRHGSRDGSARSDGSHPPAAIVVISDGAQLSGKTSPPRLLCVRGRRTSPVYSVLVGTNDGVINIRLAGGFQAVMRVPPRPGDSALDLAGDRWALLRRARRGAAARGCMRGSARGSAATRSHAR
jgi:hypothetical protein